MNISDLKTGETAKVLSVGGSGGLRRYFLDMGITPGVDVTLVGRAPLGDPLELNVRGYSLSLRLSEASDIEVELSDGDSPVAEVEDKEFGYNLSLHDHDSHPGYGEEGKYHSKADENPLPKGTVLTFALAGQQNSGKTTLFNRLTGANRHVGNFPGITMDREDRPIIGYPETLLTDLPGFYSMSTRTSEEDEARRFLLEKKPSAIINIVDAGNLERNLYLTVQLMELGIPMVLALNMMDEVKGNGGSIDVNGLEMALGIPVVPIAASRGEGLRELVEHAVHIAKYQESPGRMDFCPPDDFGGAVHRCLHSIMHLVEDHASEIGLPSRFVAGRLVEGDDGLLESLGLSRNEKEMIGHIILQMEEERGLDRNAAMADMRYSFISRLCRHTVVKPRESIERRRSRRIDRILTGKYTAVPAFLLVISLIFWLTFDVIGGRLQLLISSGLSRLSSTVSEAFASWNVNDAVSALITDAVIGGVGTVLSFLPIIVVLFFFLSILEDSGYMARIAFVSDKLLRRIGLSGRSIVPMLIGFGCSVPGVMATRTLPSSRDRKLTVMMIPYMSCSAKIAIYSFLAAAFFPGKAGLVMIGLYLLGIAVGISGALIIKVTGKRNEAAPFIMELPNYRLPAVRNVGHLIWDKVRDFLQRAFTVIFVASIVIWLLQSFDFRLTFVHNGEDSILAWIAGKIAPVFAPIGIGDWRLVTALISGFITKESVVSTMEVLGATSLLTSLTAVPMLVFCLLYTPCVAAIAAVRNELGRKWAAGMIVIQCTVAWIFAFAAYSLASLIL